MQYYSNGVAINDVNILITSLDGPSEYDSESEEY